MSNNYFNENFGNYEGDDASETSTALAVPMSSMGAPVHLSDRVASQLARYAEEMDRSENHRAGLARTALLNVGALSFLEERLNEKVPHAAKRNRTIVDSYAAGAAEKIWRY